MRIMRRIFLTAILLTAWLIPGRAGADDDALFTQRVAPVLRQRCIGCHNPRKNRGGLDLTTRAAMLHGGNDGAVVVPGSAGKSRLLEMVDGPAARMPKEGEKLTLEEIANIRKWLDAGAP